MKKEKEFVKKDVLKTLDHLGLKLNFKTGGTYLQQDYSSFKLAKQENGLYVVKADDKKIIFLSPLLFLSTVKMVEKSLNYKLFDY